MPCDVLTAIDDRYHQKWGGSGVRRILGFASEYIWVGSAIGITESVRVNADRKLDACGVRIK